MMEELTAESAAHLRQELRTTISHMIGYADLLIECSQERNLDSLVPEIRRIQSRAQSLLEYVQNHLGKPDATPNGTDFKLLGEALIKRAGEIHEITTELIETVRLNHEVTLADLGAIASGASRLVDFVMDGKMLGSTTVDTRLPTNEESQNVAKLKSQAKGGKILVVDDNHYNRVMARRWLEAEGHQVIEAQNGEVALQLLKQSPCDLILLDNLMPILNGPCTLARLKQDPDLSEIPVIMISAVDELNSINQCLELGAEDYLDKPFNPVVLRARISASLERKITRDRERKKTKELEQAQSMLRSLAAQDPLTGLANRRSIREQLSILESMQKSFSLIYMDLNGFKKINDTFGHGAGDDLLRQAGDRLQAAFRPTDVVGRWGGDEFVAVLDANLEVAQKKIGQIREILEQEFTVSSGNVRQPVQVSAAIGLATWSPGEQIDEVIRRADAAMYREKSNRTSGSRSTGQRVAAGPETAAPPIWSRA